MRVYGAGIRLYYGLKTYGTFGGLLWSPAISRQAVRSAWICVTHLLLVGGVGVGVGVGAGGLGGGGGGGGGWGGGGWGLGGGLGVGVGGG